MFKAHTIFTKVVSGIQLINRDGIGTREVTIVAVSLGLGYGLGSTANVLAQMPVFVGYIFGGSGIVPAWEMACFASFRSFFVAFRAKNPYDGKKRPILILLMLYCVAVRKERTFT